MYVRDVMTHRTEVSDSGHRIPYNSNHWSGFGERRLAILSMAGGQSRRREHNHIATLTWTNSACRDVTGSHVRLGYSTLPRRQPQRQLPMPRRPPDGHTVGRQPKPQNCIRRLRPLPLRAFGQSGFHQMGSICEFHTQW